MPEIIAHRGESFLAPENTLAAVQLAWKLCDDAVEIDVHLTADGQLVVCHDSDTERTTGRKLVIADSTAAELRALDAGAWKGEEWSCQSIPLLTEVLGTVPAGRRLFIEVKCSPEANGWVVPSLRKAIEESGKLTDQIVIISFHVSVIAEVKRLMPRYPAFLLMGFEQDDETKQWSPTVEEIIAKACETKADGVDLSASPPLDAAMVKKLQQSGLEVYTWTVDSPQEARRLMNIGVIGITTNRAGWMKRQLADPSIGR